ncbi:hypothetical protein BJY01DRAFT_247234 [Aspergillus pseudoustus]|uniref:Major facilitator superfamily domain-containing protein n=1 Tax=Aspergillus pseudoustus TaxID=1810923 RepID=A0ABR4K3X0_9EURO
MLSPPKQDPSSNMHIEEANPVSSRQRVDGIEEAKDAILNEAYANAVGYKEYREGLEISVSKKENSRVRWKIDLVVLPIFLVTQALQFMDKTALNYANLLGYQDTLGLHGQQFNHLSAMVYAGYFFGQYPCGWLVGRFPAQRALGLSCFIWGLMVIIMTQCHTFSSALAGNEIGVKTKNFNTKQVIVALSDPKAILLFVSGFAAAIPNGVVNSFSTIIIEDMGLSTTKTTEFKSVGDAVLIAALFIGGTITLNLPNSRLLTSTAANILCTAAAACMAYLPREKKWERLACFWLFNSQSVGFTISLVTISSNMAGYTHRAMANALVFTAYCWGNFAGPFVVKSSEAPEYKGATFGLLVGYAIKAGCHICLLFYMFMVNRRRDSIYGPANKA